MKKFFSLILIFILLLSTINIPLSANASSITDQNCLQQNAFEGARFLAVDGNNYLYTFVGDDTNVVNGSSIKKMDLNTGQINTVASGLGNASAFTVDPQGNIYFSYSDSSYEEVIQTIKTDGSTTIFETHNTHMITGIGADGKGNIYYKDLSSPSLKKVDASGNLTTLDNFLQIHRVTNDINGNVYVWYHYWNSGIKLDVGKIDLNGTVTKYNLVNQLINFGDDKYGMAVDTFGNVVLANKSDNGPVNSMKKVEPSGTVSDTFSGLLNYYGASVTVDSNNNYYVIDYVNNKFIVKKVSNNGVIETIGQQSQNPNPVISTPLQNQSAIEGARVEFSVNVEGCGNFTYQWFKDDQLISGETSSTLILNEVTTFDSGGYKIRVSNGLDYSVESTATLTVKKANIPSITNTSTTEDTRSEDGLVIDRNLADGLEVTHFKITGITGGILYKNDNVTPIHNGDFITYAEGKAGLKFSPNDDANTLSGGPFTFTVQAALDASGSGLSDGAQAAITVTEVNDSPIAVNDVLEDIIENSGERRILFSELIVNDNVGALNETGQQLTIVNVEAVSGGTVRIEGNQIVFVPTQNYAGPASFNYTVQDNGTTNGNPAPLTTTGSVSFTINPVAKKPNITSTITAEDTQSTNGLVITKNEFNGEEISHYKITGITGGQLYKNDGVSVINNGDFITNTEGSNGLKFTPSANANTMSGDSFTFFVQAVMGASDSGISEVVPVAITVTEVNDQPVAINDNLSGILENSGDRIILIAEIISNDKVGPSNENGQELSVIEVKDAIGGTVSIVEGNILFTPNPNFFGQASFTYTVQDNGTTNNGTDIKTDEATVSFYINPVANLPIISNTTTLEDILSTDGLIITRNFFDGEEVSYFRISDIIGGSLFKNDGSTQIFSGDYITVSEGGLGLKFLPTLNMNSLSQNLFTFKAQATIDTNGAGASDLVTANISVHEINDSPVANGETLSSIYVNAGEQIIPFTSLLINDLPGPENENSQTLTIISVDEQVGGSVRIENGNIIFTPTVGFLGTASFNYTIQDNGTTNSTDDFLTNQATVSFEIIPLPVMGGTVSIFGEPTFGEILNADISRVTYTPITLDDIPTYQWYRGETSIPGATNSTYTLMEDDIGEVIKVKVTADGIHATGNIMSSGTEVIQKARSLSPIAPELDNKTTTTITLVSVPGQEYSIDNGVNWQDSTTFTGLTPNTSYSFIARVKATTTTNESENSESKEFKTDYLTYKITYRSSGHTGGSVPNDTRLYQQGENVTILDNLGSLVRQGYTFAGWSTEADGSGSNYKTGDSFRMGSNNVTLFAKWTLNPPSSVNEPSPESNNGSSTEIITVDVDGENGELLNKTPIQRTTETNGTVKDFVTMPDTIAKETVLKAKESKNDTARIMIPDAKDIVSETKVEVPKSALSELKSGNLNFEIYTDNVTISIPKLSLEDYIDDLYFRLVPIKKEEERQQVEERAKKEEVVKAALGDGSIEVVGRPMTIETNLTSRKVDLILPLQGVTLPEDPKEREDYLNNLGIFIEHSDGDRVLVRPVPVEYKEGVQGLKFTIEKFSTFTIVKMDNLDEYFNGLDKDGSDNNESNMHKPYIYGFEDGTFRTDAFITRSQMAAMLARNLEDIETNNLQSFKDISQKNWAYNDILETTNAGIMFGVGSEQFDPKGFVTRAQMASIAYRWMQQECAKDSNVYKDCSTLENFSSANYKDVSNNHWAKEAIDFLKMTDIMIGYNDQTFKPNQKLTRAEAVKVLNRLFKRGPLTGVEAPTFKDVSSSYWAFKEIEEAAREHTFTINQNGHEVLK